MSTHAYLRVSTDLQEHGKDAQRATILSKGIPIDVWHEEDASGKDIEGRPVFQDTLDAVCREQGVLVVAKLDRMGRSVVDVLNVFERLHQCGASIKVLDMGIDTTTPMGKLMLTIFAGFAEFERSIISQRTKDGLAAAREKGVQLGRPPGTRRPLSDLSWWTLTTYRSRALKAGDTDQVKLIEWEMARRQGA